MTVLIKGMEMPKNCYVCPFCDYVSARCDAVKGTPYTPQSRYEVRAEWCPLIPVPDHGRLIYADAFIKDECNFCDGACEALPCDCLNCNADCRCDFMLHLLDAPTIIPADNDEGVDK